MRVPLANIGRHLGSEPNTPSLVVEVSDYPVIAHTVIIIAGVLSGSPPAKPEP